MRYVVLELSAHSSRYPSYKQGNSATVCSSEKNQILQNIRSMNHWKQMSTALRGYATSTSPKMTPYSPAAGATEKPQQSNFKRFMRGDFVPVYVVVGMIAVSVGLGLHTAKQHLKHDPHVYVKKERRETLPEVVEPERVVAESDKFVKNSFFRKVAHVQEFDDYNHAVKDPIRKDVFSHKPDPPRSRA